MANLAHCTGESDAVLLRRITSLLELRFREQDRRGLQERRVQLARDLSCLSQIAAKPLLLRLRIPDVRDPLTQLFMRLSGAQRQEILDILQRVVEMERSPPERNSAALGVLPPVLGTRLFDEQVLSAISEFRSLTRQEQFDRAAAVLRSLKQITSDPRFQNVDRNILKAIADRASTAEILLRDPLTQERLRVARIVPEESLSAGAVLGGLAAAASGEEVAAAAVAAIEATVPPVLIALALVALGSSLFGRRSEPTAEINLGETAMEVLNRRNRIAQATLAVLQDLDDELALQRLKEEETDIEAQAGPRVYPLPTAPRQESRPRRACHGEWVARTYGDSWLKRYHDMYATEVVSRYQSRNLFLGVNPDTERRIYRIGRGHLDFDSYDLGEDAYYEFKTQHDYLVFEGLAPDDDRAVVGWMRRSGMIEQAYRQRETLNDCGFYTAKLLWVFEFIPVANSVRPFLTPYPVDDVQAVTWGGRKFKYRRERR